MRPVHLAASPHPPEGDNASSARPIRSAMTSETAGPPVGPSPGEHSEVAGQPAAGAGDASRPDAAVDAGQPPATGVAGQPSTEGAVGPPSDAGPSGDAATAAGTATAVASAEEPPPPAKHRKPRKLLYFTLPGCW